MLSYDITTDITTDVLVNVELAQKTDMIFRALAVAQGASIGGVSLIVQCVVSLVGSLSPPLPPVEDPGFQATESNTLSKKGTRASERRPIRLTMMSGKALEFIPGLKAKQ